MQIGRGDLGPYKGHQTMPLFLTSLSCYFQRYQVPLIPEPFGGSAMYLTVFCLPVWGSTFSGPIKSSTTNLSASRVPNFIANISPCTVTPFQKALSRHFGGVWGEKKSTFVQLTLWQSSILPFKKHLLASFISQSCFSSKFIGDSF